MRWLGLWLLALAASIGLAACTDGTERVLGEEGDPCNRVTDCREGLFCSAEGACYDPEADGDADSDADGDGDADSDSDGDVDGDSDPDGDGDEPCLLPDTDGDTIADIHEGEADPDGDEVPNSQDPDSDGDGISDATEAGDDDPCTPPANHDGDGSYDFIDLDSDADGLTDTEEALLGSSPYHVDTDGDGWTDFVERVAGTRPDDGEEYPSDEVILFILPYMDLAGPQAEELAFETTIRIADVFFLMDTTHSMSEEIANLRDGLSDIAAALAELLDDVAMGVGRFDDFPLLPYGDILSGDRVFDLVQQVTTDEGRVQDGVDDLDVHSGEDDPEGHVPALWHVATGDSIGMYVLPTVLDPRVPGTGAIGGAGFRHDSQPIVVVVSDAPMHGDADGNDPYDEGMLAVDVPSYDEAVDALAGIGARVVGIAGEAAYEDLVDVVRDTGTVRSDDSPLIYTINPDGTGTDGDLSNRVVAGIEELVLGTPQDVSTLLEDDPSDAFNAALFIDEVRPLRGDPEPPEGYDHHDGDTDPFGTFYGVIPGTTVYFSVQAYNDLVEETESTQVFRVDVVVMGNGVTRLDERPVFIVVPAESGEVPIE